ncbi:MAG TPA: lysylphosphatidylglycerol synthase transmembrane domain-containing protein [Gaiellales bacterium]|nr:lysylphosphatidylglycerol synthase transmembrane domain-containing protein [Gaiellales bacterium]
MQDELSQLGAATAAWGDRFGDTHLLPLAAALLLHLASLIVRAGVWRGILAAAFPDRRVPMRSAFLAYVAGIGANVVAPFRGGDVVRVVAIRRELGGASVTTIVSTLVAETAFGAVVVAAMVFGAAGLGWLPPIVHLPDAGAFEISFTADHALLAAGIAVIVAGAGLAAAEWANRHVRGFCQRVMAGLRILRSPGRFARAVAAPQVLDWVLRVGTAYALLAAFGIPATLRYAVLAVVIDSISTALPFTPGGIGAQQGLLVFALAGAAGTSQVMAYSIGAQAVILASNLLLGVVAVFVLFGQLRFGAVRHEAHVPG